MLSGGVADMNFNDLFLNLKMPVVVCESQSLKLSYINTEAKALLYIKINNKSDNLRDVILPKSETQFDCLLKTLQESGFVSDFILTLTNASSENNPAVEKIKINANRIGSNKQYYCFYLSSECVKTDMLEENLEGELIRILSAAYRSADLDETINIILGLLGSAINVSRVYIFETVNSRFTSNTYEWCAPGIESMIDNLQHIPFDAFNYEAFTSDTGMVLCNDIREMNEDDRKSMEKQGVKSILTVPYFDANQPIGFIGCDECVNYRKWNAFEIKLLLNTSFIITSLIMRKRTQSNADTAFQIMERVVDNIEAMVFAVNIDNNRVIYMNSAMARERGIKDLEKEELYCYQMFMRDVNEPCKYCVNRQLLDDAGKPRGTMRSEFQSTINNKWYAMSSTVIEWINGEYVYLHSTVEITDRKNNEDILKKSASMDSMTNVYNREWGYNALDMLITDTQDSGIKSTIIFIDVDGLKYVNDNYGHIEGDKIIIGIVNALKKCTRKNDIIFRWGGDEFIVLLPGCTEKNAELIMNNTCAMLDEINLKSQKPYQYAFSYGIFEIGTQDLYTADAVVKTADALMYEQKNRKKAVSSR